MRGGTSGTSSVVTSPVVPLIAITSPLWSSVPLTETVPPSTSTWRSEAPATHGRPMPRATRAACEALPPSDVTIPFAASNPATSSASVKGRTRITASPPAARPTASSAENAIAPFAAPGEAGTPRASGS